MEIEQEALAFVRHLIKLYFEHPDAEGLTACQGEQTIWIGTGADELGSTAALARQWSAYGGTFQADAPELAALALSGGGCVVCGHVRAVPAGGALEVPDLRVSFVCEKTKHGMKLLHRHISQGDRLQAAGACAVPQKDDADRETLLSQLRCQDKRIQRLVRNIPGGVHRCKTDSGFTLLEVSDEFLSMFGYTKEELHTRFGGRLLNMVSPADRAEVAKTTRAQLQQGETTELEYRVICKNGLSLWVLEKGRLIKDDAEGPCLYSILIDITQRKREQEALRLSLERYQVVIDQATDIIFEWDLQKDTLSFSSNWRKKFGYDPIRREISKRIPRSHNIHPKDQATFVTLMKDTAAGVPYSEAEFRIQNSGGCYLWCRIRATTQFDEDHRPIKAVGIIADIDEEKRQRQVLMEQAQRDALTGLYNKVTVNNLVEQRMRLREPTGHQALMIIDIDHFKAVNDTYGHLVGDSLLSDVATVLKSSIRVTDLVGRIGGDEFLVYLPEIADETAAQLKAENILTALQLITPTNGAPPISCSVGVAYFPRGSIDYFALYKCADQALYFQKNNGRSGVALYTPSLNMGQISCGLSPTAVGEFIVSDEGNVIDDQMAQYCFRILYSAQDISDTLNQLLEIIGRSYDVSRVYIFESSEDGERSSMTFEWCAEGVSPQLDALQDFSYEGDLGNYKDNFDRDGLFYCHDIENTTPALYAVLQPQGIRSMLQCAIWESGQFWGGVGFDECRQNFMWSPRQVAAFRLTANVLSSFLVKLRLRQKLDQLTK